MKRAGSTDGLLSVVVAHYRRQLGPARPAAPCVDYVESELPRLPEDAGAVVAQCGSRPGLVCLLLPARTVRASVR
jgi:hypothetical protein